MVNKSVLVYESALRDFLRAPDGNQKLGLAAVDSPLDSVAYKSLGLAALASPLAMTVAD